MNARLIALDAISGRALYVLTVPTLADVPSILDLSGRRFACLVVMDATSTSDDELAAFANKLAASGAAYVCAWGPGCGAVEKSAICAGIGTDPPGFIEDFVMLPSNESDTLEEAIYFAVSCSWPDPMYEKSYDTILGVVVGRADWAAEVRTAFKDTKGLVKRVFAKGK